MSARNRHVELTEVPIGVTLMCPSCRVKRTAVRWFPRRNWERYAKSDIYSCTSCGAFCKYIEGKEVKHVLIKRGADVFIGLSDGDFSTRILQFSPTKINIRVDGLSNISFNGTFNLMDKGGVMASLIFGPKGLQYIDLNTHLFLKYGAIIDEKTLATILERFTSLTKKKDKSSSRPSRRRRTLSPRTDLGRRREPSRRSIDDLYRGVIGGRQDR